MKPEYRKRIEEIIQELVEQNPTIINAGIAEQVTNRLGKPIRKEQIGHIRRDIGLATRSIALKDMVRDLAGMAKISPATS